MSKDKYTLVAEHYVRGLCNHRLRFGIGQTVITHSRGLKYHAFKPFQTFALIRWQRNEYGTILWTLYVCETSSAGRLTQMPGVYPGASLLFRARGTKAMGRALAMLDTLENRAGGDLTCIPVSYWRQLANGQDRNMPLPPLNDYLRCRHA